MPLELPSDADVAALCTLIYSPTVVAEGWDFFDVGDVSAVVWGLKHLPGYDVVVFRGSIVELDWLRDFRALTTLTRLGHLHGGFYAGMEQAWAAIRPQVTQPVIFAGHSLGAARASIATGLARADGVSPVRRVVFGEPKPGLLDFALRVKGVPGASYRNGTTLHHDLVTDVPLSFPPFQYVHPTPVVPVNCEPTGSLFQRWGVFAFHHMPLYLSALRGKPLIENAAAGAAQAQGSVPS